MSDNFDRRVCNGLQSTKKMSAFKYNTQLDNTNLGQSIAEQYLFCSICGVKRSLEHNMVRSKFLNIF